MLVLAGVDLAAGDSSRGLHDALEELLHPLVLVSYDGSSRL
jgi:hypothetical protein